MEGILDSVFDVYQFPTRRRLYTLTEVMDRATAAGRKDIAERAARGVALDTETARMEETRRDEARNSYGPEAVELNTVLDRLVGNTDRCLVLQSELHAGTDKGDAADRLRTTFYPRGVHAVTSAPFVEEHVMVNEILAHLDDPRVAADVALFPDLGLLLRRMREVNTAYGKSLQGYLRAPSMDEIRTARAAGQTVLLETMVLILGLCISKTPAEAALGKHLLEPILRQNDEIGKARRKRRQPNDIEDELDLPDDEDTTQPAADNQQSAA